MTPLFRSSRSRRFLLKASGAIALSSAFPPVNGLAVHATTMSDGDSRTGTANFLELMGHVDKRMEELAVPAVGVAVVDGNKRHTCALGITSVDDPQLVDAETMFRVGPISELFTGSALGALIEDGAIDLDEPVRAYLPSFAVGDGSASDHLTVRNLATHQTGWSGRLPLHDGEDNEAVARYVAAISSLRQVDMPGQHFNYVSANGILTGHLIATMAGLPFEEAVRELTLDPLSMDQSSFLAADVRHLPLAHGHTRRQGRIETVEPLVSHRSSAPISGLFSNLNEILQFASFHAFASTPPTFLGTSIRETMHHPLGPGGSIGPVRVDATGINWMIIETGGTAISMHTGSGDGHSSVIAAVPSKEFAVVVFTNADFAKDLAVEIAHLALDLFRETRVSPPSPIERPEAELRRLEGTYSDPDTINFRVAGDATGLRVDGIVRGAVDQEISSNLTFVSPLTAMVSTPDGNRFIDFVMDDDGRVGWLRHMGQLVARVDA